MKETIRANKKRDNIRKFTGGGPRPDNNEHKQREAKERNADWATLSPKQQLEMLDRRLGKGVGAKKQRNRLVAILSRTSSGKTVDVPLVEQHTRPEKTKAKDRRETQQQDRPSRS